MGANGAMMAVVIVILWTALVDRGAISDAWTRSAGMEVNKNATRVMKAITLIGRLNLEIIIDWDL